MVAHSYERALLEAGEHLKVIDAEFEFKLLVYQSLGEAYARSVAISAVNTIHLIDSDKVKKGVHKLLMSVKERGSLADIVISHDLGT
jgi:hypothetical protein